MSGGKLFHAVGPATQNARFPRRRLVRGTGSSLAAERQKGDAGANSQNRL